MDANKVAVDTYEKIAEKYAQQYFNDTVDFPYIDSFLNLLPGSAKILDVGCGPGQFSKYMLDKGFDVTGIDFSNKMIAIAQQKVQEGAFSYMDMRKLTYPENYFDGIFSAYSLIHIPTNEVFETLVGFNRVLKANGYIEIAVQQGQADQVVQEPFMLSEKMFFNFFTKERMASYLIDAGFEIVSQELMPIDDAETMSDNVIYTIGRKNKELYGINDRD